jgi:catechol 2,3-dioxygenase-like lactoylglutathione lyase family enzyme
MAKVLGIGGVFVKAKDPDALRAWYRDVFGLDIQSWGGAQLFNEGKTFGVWSPFSLATDYFDPSTKDFMINFRVDDLDAVLGMLRERGARVLDRREDTDDGKFGYVMDPEGTLLELYEPAR